MQAMGYKTPISPLRAQVVGLVAAGKSDKEIAAALGISKNQVIGQRHRAALAANVDLESAKSRNWALHKEVPTTTLFDRMTALEAAMDAVLAETRLRRADDYSTR